MARASATGTEYPRAGVAALTCRSRAAMLPSPTASPHTAPRISRASRWLTPHRPVRCAAPHPPHTSVRRRYSVTSDRARGSSATWCRPGRGSSPASASPHPPHASGLASTTRSTRSSGSSGRPRPAWPGCPPRAGPARSPRRPRRHRWRVRGRRLRGVPRAPPPPLLQRHHPLGQRHHLLLQGQHQDPHRLRRAGPVCGTDARRRRVTHALHYSRSATAPACLPHLNAYEPPLHRIPAACASGLSIDA